MRKPFRPRVGPVEALQRVMKPVAILALLFFIGCAGAVHSAVTPDEYELPEAITAANYQANSRLLQSMSPNHAQRPALRDRVVSYLAEAAADASTTEELAKAVASMVDLLTPADFAEGTVPVAMVPAALRLAALTRQLGQEGTVMGVLRLARAAGHTDGDAEYAEIMQWGHAAREQIPNPMQRLSDLIRVWDQHAALSPAPEVLAQLADLHVERRDAVASVFQDGTMAMLQGRPGIAAQVMRIAPLDVAAVYLRHGDLATATTRIEAMGADGETEAQLLTVLAQARGSRGADALMELASAYQEARPAVARGICRLGLQRFGTDPRFPTCLAQVAGAAGDQETAISWYEAAIHAEPTQERYDAALTMLEESVEQHLQQHDNARARRLAHVAEHLVAERSRRYGEDSPFPQWRIDWFIGIAEWQLGVPAEAEQRFRQSVTHHPTPEVYERLGQAQERLGRYSEAVVSYRAALDLIEHPFLRALQLQHLGDGYRGAQDLTQSARMYREVLVILDELDPTRDVWAQRGYAWLQLGEMERAETAFQAAINAEPTAAPTYASILSWLAVTQADPDFMRRVFRQATRHLTITPHWQVYYAMWTAGVARQAGLEPAPEVLEVLQRNARGESWLARLAAFGVGTLSRDDLISAASSAGERTEAYFYAGHQLSFGDPVARDLFQHALAEQIPNFYEYQMAQQLLLRMGETIR